ncbi:MAG: glycolate oxidase subunit GlcF [Proteobacteria bacterium]|nr:glycolate oxidase subunit GlcF [Pseudomonadota bacterium]
MQTNFSLAQLADPDIEAANEILRKCVHCGFCTATCPTYVLLGDELDSPRGRIYQIKQTLETGRPASASLTKHLDRCLSCLACTTTCPSGVDYMHLIDHARVLIEKTYRRPLADRLMRRLLALVLPCPAVFRLALIGAAMARPFRRFFPGRLGAMLALAPDKIAPPADVDRPQIFKAIGERQARVVLMSGCAQQVLRSSINEATVRVLTRHGCEVVIANGAGCCGALVHHMGREDDAHAAAKRNIAAWERVERESGGIDAIVINASGCGTTVKDYGWMLRLDSAWADRAKRYGGLAKDVTEVMTGLDVAPKLETDKRIRVAYHSACSMQHGQKLKAEPVALLRKAGFEVCEPAESHLCCGSAGTYNIMQPEIARQLQERKAGHLRVLEADVIATGNIGCLMQIANGLTDADDPKIVHTVELLDWATGGPVPPELDHL